MFDEKELEAVIRVMKSGNLSGYVAGSLTGGKEVEALEREWEEYFNVKHAIAVNSATSGLLCACSVVEDFPFIITPFSMSASAAIPFHTNDIYFLDIEDQYFCLKEFIEPYEDYNALVVDLFGHPFDPNSLKVGGFIIEDASQAIGATFDGQYAGTFGDIGVFSLNYHKHIHCGEGGVVVTNDENIAELLRLVRNHSENVNHLIGFNFRLTELQAAIAREQLKKLKTLLEQRREKVAYFLYQLENTDNLILPQTREGCTHSYYLVPIRIKQGREKYIGDLKSTGIDFSVGYTTPLHRIPLFRGISKKLPVVEKVHSDLICFSVTPETTKSTLDKVIKILQENKPRRK